MNACKQLSPLVAAQQALAERQLVVLKDWLGEDHELLQQWRFSSPARTESWRPQTDVRVIQEAV